MLAFGASKRRPRDGKPRNGSGGEGGTCRMRERAFSARAAVKPAVSTNVRNIYLHELNPAYTL